MEGVTSVASYKQGAMDNIACELLKTSKVYNYSEFEALHAVDGISGTLRCVHKETNEIAYIKPLKINEWIAGFLYRAFLQDRAPEQDLVYNIDDNGNKNFYLCSKSLGENLVEVLETNATENVSNSLVMCEENTAIQSIEKAQVLDPVNVDRIIIDNKNFAINNYAVPSYAFYNNGGAKIEGMEKIFTAFIIFNEYDSNIANILIRKELDAEGSVHNFACKIDNGYSLHIPSKALFLAPIYDLLFEIGRMADIIGLQNCKNFSAKSYIEALEDGNEFLRSLNACNSLLFNEFLKTQFRFLYNNGVFQTKEETIDALKLFKIVNGIATTKHIELLDEAISNIKILSSAFYNDSDFQGTRFFNLFMVDTVELIHPFFTIATYNNKIDGIGPVEWYSEHHPKLLKNLLSTYSNVRSKYQEDTRYDAEIKQPFIPRIDATILNAGEVAKKFAPNFYQELEQEYAELTMGCESLFE